ncbi:unnamed protein product [Tetraodon nigroviridis]|uniref:(spotted green pufferfish) hypothetical protein n=1 Tax=Tetraodon nigroviridis TaxID=99883 RepID=Q4SGF6_TETNG|nr:unnamed protein product [Tetraodon nigroviridis]
MGQVFSTETERSQLKEAVGSALYDAMLEGDAVPDLELQSDMGDRAPAYLRDLIGRLSTFSDEPRLAGLVGFVVTVLVDMVYTSKRSSVKGTLAGSSSSQVG